MIKVFFGLMALTFVVVACSQKKLTARGEKNFSAETGRVAVAAGPTPVTDFPQSRPLDEAKPVKITSNSLEYLDKKQETRFTGKVRVKQDGATLYADRLVARNQGETANAEGHIRLVDEDRKILMTADKLDYANQLSVANMEGGFRLNTQDPYGRALTVTGDTARIWPRAGKADIRGGVILLRGAITATAQTASVDSHNGMVSMSETVKVKFGKNQFRAGRATLARDGSRLVLEDNVKAYFIPAELQEAADNPGEAP